jgi:hypothetical protein
MYNDCQEAISNLKNNGSSNSNVNKDSQEVSCNLAKTKCNWIGSGVHYACVKKVSDAAVNVYDGFSGGNQSTISKHPDN